MKNIGIALLLVAIAIAGRTIIHLGPNIEFLTVTSLLAAVYLPKKYAFFVPLAAVGLSDMILKNTSIFIFTWSAWIIIGLSGLLLKKIIKRYKKTVITATGWSLITAIFFFLWTNFGVWYQGWCPPGASGLIQCYVDGLTFLKMNIFGGVLFVPIGFTIAEFLTAKARKTIPIH